MVVYYYILSQIEPVTTTFHNGNIMDMPDNYKPLYS